MSRRFGDWVMSDVVKVKTLTFNTGNSRKWNQLNRMFKVLGRQRGVIFVLKQKSKDYAEIDGTPLQVAAHKATVAGMSVIVEDTSLEVEGLPFKPTHIKWHMHELGAYLGRKAVFRSCVAVRFGFQAMVYVGEVKGTIVKPVETWSWKKKSLECWFRPQGTVCPLSAMGLEAGDKRSARFAAYSKMVTGVGYVLVPTIKMEAWKGAWQPTERATGEQEAGTEIGARRPSFPEEEDGELGGGDGELGDGDGELGNEEASPSGTSSSGTAVGVGTAIGSGAGTVQQAVQDRSRDTDR